MKKEIKDISFQNIAEWIIENYENFFFDNSLQLSISSMIKEIQATTDFFFNTYLRDFTDIKVENNENLPSDLKIEYLKANDKILLISSSNIKLLSRNSSGKFDFEFLRLKSNDGSNLVKQINILININELKDIVELVNWKQLINYNFDNNSFRSIYYFFDSLKKLVKISDELVMISLKPKLSIRFVEILMTYLNKLVFCSKEYDSLVEEIKKKPNVNFDKEIDQSLPFAPEYEAEETINEEDFHMLDQYKISNFDKLLTAYKGVLFMYEQIGLVNREIDFKKKNFIYQNIRFSSAFSRLSTFVNYPFTRFQNVLDLANRGFFVVNALSHKLSLFNHEATKVYLFNLDSQYFY